jgi:ribosome-associated toxin RatA of RatAB toxin-antitoxin module
VAVDSPLVEDMVNVFKLVEKVRNYPDTLGYQAEFDIIERRWRLGNFH